MRAGGSGSGPSDGSGRSVIRRHGPFRAQGYGMLRFTRAAVPVSIAIALAVAGCGAASQATPIAATSASESALPGTPGHFDDGQLSFDYPSDWKVLGGGPNAGSPSAYILAVLGNGTWGGDCQTFAAGSVSGMTCGLDTVEVPPGGIVVKVYRWYGGPAVPCRGETQANATLGQYAVRKLVDGNVTSWEIRPPGNEFGQPNNIFVEAHASNPNQLARAEAVVQSLRFEGSEGTGMGCDSFSPGADTPVP